MSQTVENALSVLRAHDIDPCESEEDVADLPGLGTIEEGETVYATSLDDSIDPGATASTAQLTSALTRHYGYSQAPGGKGSHVKHVKPNAPNIHLPGNRPVVSPGLVKQVLGVFGGYRISRLPDLLRGQLPQPKTSSLSP